MDQLSMILGRELTADDFEPLTWTLAEIGRSRSAARYLLDVGLHQGLSRMSRAGSSRASTCC